MSEVSSLHFIPRHASAFLRWLTLLTLCCAYREFAKSCSAFRADVACSAGLDKLVTPHATERHGDVDCGTDTDGNRLVLFMGGTFDPVTVGHLEMARLALPYTDCVWFATHDHPDYKPKKVSYKFREAMLEEIIRTSRPGSIAGTSKFALSQAYKQSFKAASNSTEMDADAHRWLQEHYPETSFNVVVGSDALLYPWAWTTIVELLVTQTHPGSVFVIPRSNDNTTQLKPAMQTIFQNVKSKLGDSDTPWPFLRIPKSDTADGIAATNIRSKICDIHSDKEILGLAELGLPEVLAQFLVEHPEIVSDRKSVV